MSYYIRILYRLKFFDYFVAFEYLHLYSCSSVKLPLYQSINSLSCSVNVVVSAIAPIEANRRVASSVVVIFILNVLVILDLQLIANMPK